MAEPTGGATIRELGGEIWAELSLRVPETQLSWRAKDAIVDVIMGVLARHEGARILNDRDLPVEVLPKGTSPR